MTERVLIVEDDPDLRDLLAFNFKSKGFEIDTADDGEEALALLEDANDLPDAIVLEILLPEIDGIELLRRCNSDDRLATIPTVVLSAVGDEETVAKAYELGTNDYLTKPFSPNELITRVTHLE
jgi:DNA-binding response OmpR family regulator